MSNSPEVLGLRVEGIVARASALAAYAVEGEHIGGLLTANDLTLGFHNFQSERLTIIH